MNYPYQGQPTQTQYGTQQTSAINVPQQQRQSTGRGRAATTTVTVTAPYDYQEQSANLQYGQQSSALAVPPQPRQSTRPHSISPQASSRVDYLEQSGHGAGYPSSYTGTSHAQMAYSDPAYDSGFLTAGPVNPGFPEPHPSAAGGGAIQRSHSGHYRDAASSGGSANVRRSPSAHSTNLYAPTNSSVRRSPSEQSSNLRAPVVSSARRSPSAHSSTLYAPTNVSVQRSPSEQSATLYAPAGYSVQSRSRSQQPPAYYPSDAQPFDSTGTSHVGPQPTSHYAVPHGHGANASDGRYQTTGPVTRVTPEPPYRAVHIQERGAATSQPQYGGVAYEYDNLNENEHVPKGPAPGPVQGRSHSCRMPGCNRPMYFDRRFNEFWEWCSVQHIHEALGRGMEKVCKRCAVWPRKYGTRYCGGDACNKRGVPL